MIENKYIFEYIHPDDAKKESEVSSHKYSYGFAIGALSLVALAYYLVTLPTKKMDQQPNVVIKQQAPAKKVEQKTKITTVKEIVEKQKITSPIISSSIPETSAPKTITSKEKEVKVVSKQASLAPNEKSFKEENQEKDSLQKKNESAAQPKPEDKDSLAVLKAQLLETQKRNKELATELDEQIMENMELAALLEDSLYKINKEDKSYIKELKKLEQNTIVVTTTSKKSSKNPLTMIKTTIPLKSDSATPIENTKTTAITKETNKKTNLSNNNRIDLSTASQVDAIIANLKTTNDSPQKSIHDKKGISTQLNQDVNIEASKVKLQDNINPLIH